jgi:hypothetical protein
LLIYLFIFISLFLYSHVIKWTIRDCKNKISKLQFQMHSRFLSLNYFANTCNMKKHVKKPSYSETFLIRKPFWSGRVRIRQVPLYLEIPGKLTAEIRLGVKINQPYFILKYISYLFRNIRSGLYRKWYISCWDEESCSTGCREKCSTGWSKTSHMIATSSS